MSEKDLENKNEKIGLEPDKKSKSVNLDKNNSLLEDKKVVEKMDKNLEKKDLKKSEVDEKNLSKDKNKEQNKPDKTIKAKSKNEGNNIQKSQNKIDEKENNKTQKNINATSSKSSKNNNEDGSEYVEKLVSINRVAKVVKGGRRFSFAALVVVGDGNGMVGHGKGKAKEVPEAIKKATDEAKLNMLRVPLRQGRTLHHDISGRFDSGRVYLRSAPSGTGVIAGGPMRAVFEALGIQDIVAKSVGSSNPHNMIRATFEALKMVTSPKIIATRRGLKINDITKRRKISPSGQGGSQDG